MRLFLPTLAALAASASLFAQSVPATPAVTVGAGIKSLRFDWTPTARAARYELWQRASSSAAFGKTAEFPATADHADLRIAAHSLDWSAARFRIAACNSSGCANSRDISVANLRLEVPGYFKSSRPEVAETFGSDVDVTPNGEFFVTAAPNDDSNGVANAGAAYVFQRTSDGSGWTQRTRLSPGIIQADGGAGMRVAISADGHTVAMGLPNIFHSQADPNSGEVYVFRNSGGSWQRASIAAPRRGSFGAWVSVDDAGKVVAIGRDTGADLYVLASGGWAARRHMENRTAPADNCPNGAISGNGRLLVEHCFNGSATSPTRAYLRIHPSYTSSRRDHDMQRAAGASSEQRYGLAVDYAGDWIAAQNFNGRIVVDVFQKVAGWHQFSQRVTSGAWQVNRPSLFGQGLSLSEDARVLAVGDPLDVAQGAGVQRGALGAGSSSTGAVYVFRRNDGGAWPLQAVVKPNYLLGPGGGAAQTFGAVLSLSQDGATLAVGQPLESSDAVGVDGAWNNTRRARSGAVWLY